MTVNLDFSPIIEDFWEVIIVINEVSFLSRLLLRPSPAAAAVLKHPR